MYSYIGAYPIFSSNWFQQCVCLLVQSLSVSQRSSLGLIIVPAVCFSGSHGGPLRMGGFGGRVGLVDHNGRL